VVLVPSLGFSLLASGFEIRCPHLDLMNPFCDCRLTDVERACPGVSRDMIRLRLRNLKATGRIECLGRGPGAKWRKRVATRKLNNKTCPMFSAQ